MGLRQHWDGMTKRRALLVRAALPQLLRKMRGEAGLSQVALAKRINRPQSFVSKYESGARRLDIVEVFEICAACGITLTSFSGRLERAAAGEPKRG